MVEIFKALAEESRLRILSLLLQNEMCVCEIEECLNMSQSNVSRHLTALKKCQILDSYKQAQWAYYKISDKFIEENKALWTYLEEKLRKYPEFTINANCSSSCNQHDLCNTKSPTKQ